MLSEKTLKRIMDKSKNNKNTVSDIETNDEEEPMNQQEHKECCKEQCESCSVGLGAQKIINNNNESNRIAVSKIAINVEDELSNLREDDYVPIKTSRTLERNFVRIIEALNQNKKDYKDKDGNYTVDTSVQAAIAAILIESTKKDGLIDKLMKGKAEAIEMKDTIAYFDNLINYTDGKMDEGERNAFLLSQDEGIGYSLTTILFNIQRTLMAMYMNMQVYPYEYQVTIMQELFQEVFVKFNERITKDVEEFVKSNIAKRLIEKDLPGVNEYPNKGLEEYYKKIDEAVINLLNNNGAIRKQIERELKCNIDELK